MIFIDSNVPMYLVGAPHPNKDRARVILTKLIQDGEYFVTDVEVYQEILHRYTAVRRHGAVDAAFRNLDAIADDILSFGRAEVQAARRMLDVVHGISARDALHIAVMRSVGVARIVSFDRGFDACSGIERLS